MIRLAGSTWDTDRGFGPLAPAAAAFSEMHPEVEIRWEKRLLQEFAHAPADILASHFDCVVLDHPWVGFMADTGCYLPLDEWLPSSFLQKIAENSVGPSFRSYKWKGHQWALPIDAAAPCASWRPDLLARLGWSHPPRNWDEALALGRDARTAKMQVALPLSPVDAISAFLSLAANLGATPFTANQVVERDVASQVLQALSDFRALCGATCLTDTPISVMERMSTLDTLVYCPHSYNYVNYSRDSYRPHLCLYGDMPSLHADGDCRGSHIGGTGLAISSRCRHPAIAAEYAAFVMSKNCQCGLYFDAGGQPGHTAAWESAKLNEQSHDFFRNTRATMESAYLRPRYNGYIAFQCEAGEIISSHFANASPDVRETTNALDAIYLKYLPPQFSEIH